MPTATKSVCVCVCVCVCEREREGGEGVFVCVFVVWRVWKKVIIIMRKYHVRSYVKEHICLAAVSEYLSCTHRQTLFQNCVSENTLFITLHLKEQMQPSKMVGNGIKIAKMMIDVKMAV